MLSIVGGTTLLQTGWAPCPLSIADGVIQPPEAAPTPTLQIDATGLLALPGIIDIHGDAFERSIMPRPGVSFALQTALRDVDNQLVSQGVTTAFHGITCSFRKNP